MNSNLLRCCFVIVGVATLFFLSTCSSEGNTQDESGGPDPKMDAELIVKKLIERNPTFVCAYKDGKKEKIAAIVKSTEGLSGKAEVILLSEFAGQWEIESRKDLDRIPKLVEGECVTIDSEHYLYFHSEAAEGSAGNIYTTFNLVNLSNMRLHTLGHSAFNTMGGYSGKFENLKTLDAYPKLLSFLENKAAKSEVLQRVKKPGKSLGDPELAIKKWKIDNPGIHDVGRNSNISIAFPTYSDNLIDLNLASIAAEDENPRYRVVSKFKSAVYVHDKRRNEYLVIWVPTGQYMWISDVEISDSDVATLKIGNDQHHEINLRSKTYTRKR